LTLHAGGGTMIARAAILVVEDETSLRTTMCAALTLMGFMTHQAQSVDEALKILGAEHVDAIVLDVRLPDPTGLQTSGLHLLRFVRATPEHAHIPVLVFTGVPLSPSEAETVRANGGHVFYKPQPYRVLIDQLNELLNTSAG
jgi:DNA-binding response OmpR family regulator